MLENLVGSDKEKYTAQDFSHLKGIAGLSDNQLETHFALYNGYVDNTNKFLDDMSRMREAGEAGSPEYAELKRRFGWEFDGMRLHELYFSGLGMDGGILDPGGKLYEKMADQFGSFDKWQDDFVATGKMRGIGWVVLYQDLKNGKLMNFWINEHDTGHLVGGNPILIMDVFEHAFFIDYGKDKAKYIDAYMKIIKWEEVEKRMK